MIECILHRCTGACTATLGGRQRCEGVFARVRSRGARPLCSRATRPADDGARGADAAVRGLRDATRGAAGEPALLFGSVPPAIIGWSPTRNSVIEC